MEPVNTQAICVQVFKLTDVALARYVHAALNLPNTTFVPEALSGLVPNIKQYLTVLEVTGLVRI